MMFACTLLGACGGHGGDDKTRADAPRADAPRLDAPAAAPFPAPPTVSSHPDLAPFPWVFYDTTDMASVFELEGPHWYGELSAQTGATFSVTVTALASSTDPVPDATKLIDAALFEGVHNADGTYAWTQVARAFSTGGVITLVGTSSSSDLIHVLAVEADPSSYDTSLSPAVHFEYLVTCAAADHAACAVGAQPGEACTIDPAGCDGPFQWCFSPEGACGNTGTCVRTDVLCTPLGPAVCTCDGFTEPNICYSNGDHKQVLHEGACD